MDPQDQRAIVNHINGNDAEQPEVTRAKEQDLQQAQHGTNESDTKNLDSEETQPPPSGSRCRDWAPRTEEEQNELSKFLEDQFEMQLYEIRSTHKRLAKAMQSQFIQHNKELQALQGTVARAKLEYELEIDDYEEAIEELENTVASQDEQIKRLREHNDAYAEYIRTLNHTTFKQVRISPREFVAPMRLEPRQHVLNTVPEVYICNGALRPFLCSFCSEISNSYPC